MRNPCKGCGTQDESHFEHPDDVACVKCNEDAAEVEKEILDK